MKPEEKKVEPKDGGVFFLVKNIYFRAYLSSNSLDF
jgi:hypothetical protein